MTESDRRRQRSRRYEWLAAVFSGPLGMALAGHPELGTRYPSVYATCPGHPDLACRDVGGVPRVCLVRRFENLAESARKGGLKRRRTEAQRVRELLLCLDALEAGWSAQFKPVLAITRQALKDDLRYLNRFSPEKDAAPAEG